MRYSVIHILKATARVKTKVPIFAPVTTLLPMLHCSWTLETVISSERLKGGEFNSACKILLL